MNITVTGATGFIGRYLVQSLAKDGHSVRALSRAAWNVFAGEPPAASLTGVDAVVHLAGVPVAQRWTRANKQTIRASRVDGTHHLVTALSTLSRRPEVLVCASAIGIYGDRGDEVLTETSPVGKGFLPEVCRDWDTRPSWPSESRSGARAERSRKCCRRSARSWVDASDRAASGCRGSISPILWDSSAMPSTTR